MDKIDQRESFLMLEARETKVTAVCGCELNDENPLITAFYLCEKHKALFTKGDWIMGQFDFKISENLFENRNNEVKIIETQMKEKELRIIWWNARIVSGECKSRKLYHGAGGEFTDEEKVRDAVETMDRFIIHYSELATRLFNVIAK